MSAEDRFFDALFTILNEGNIVGSVILAVLVFFFLSLVLIPINVYFAQRHARLCRDELKEQTIILKKISTELKIDSAESQ